MRAPRSEPGASLAGWSLPRLSPEPVPPLRSPLLALGWPGMWRVGRCGWQDWENGANGGATCAPCVPLAKIFEWMGWLHMHTMMR